MTESRTDAYGYNGRNELASAVKSTASSTNLTEYAYTYDDIGNRLASLDLGTNRTYTANSLNQYTQISNLCDSASLREEFIPQFDLDGNQTLIKTATGTWSVTYNGENRPVCWERVLDASGNEPASTLAIAMSFDRMGRRVEYLETESTEEEIEDNGVTNLVVTVATNAHHRFVYDGYLCIQRLNAASNNAIDLAFGWDPSEPVATRPMIMQKYGEYTLFYTHDGNKNVSDLVFFQRANGIAAHYEYAPFGAVTATSSSTPVTAYDFRTLNPYRFSSEYHDHLLHLVYYNFQYYSYDIGKWCARDMFDWLKMYAFLANDSLNAYDCLGLFRTNILPVRYYNDLGNIGDDNDVYIVDPNSQGCLKALDANVFGWTWAKLDVYTSCRCDRKLKGWVLDDAVGAIEIHVHFKERYHTRMHRAIVWKDEHDHVNDIVQWATSLVMRDIHETEAELSKQVYKDRNECVAITQSELQKAFNESYESVMEQSRKRWDESGAHSYDGGL